MATPSCTVRPSPGWLKTHMDPFQAAVPGTMATLGLGLLSEL